MLNGKRIIVTGAAQGIGAALAAGFAEMGASVMLADVDDPADAALRIRARAGEAQSVIADVSSLADCRAMVKAAETAYGGLDGIVCNAALFTALPLQAFDDISETLWDRVHGSERQGTLAVHAGRGTGNGAVRWWIYSDDLVQPNPLRVS